MKKKKFKSDSKYEWRTKNKEYFTRCNIKSEQEETIFSISAERLRKEKRTLNKLDFKIDVIL